MPGQRITDKQVNRYKELRRKLTQEVAAAKVGISLRTARRIEQSAALPSQRPVRCWRTRTDPLASVWDSEIVPLLQRAPGLNAVTLLEEMQRRHPEHVGPNLLRTLQRRLRQWRALEGEEREVFALPRLLHEPGRLGLSDFTRCGGTCGNPRRDPVRASALSICISLLRLAARRGVILGGELGRVVGRPAERALELGRRTAGASHRLAIGGVQQSCRARRAHTALR